MRTRRQLNESVAEQARLIDAMQGQFDAMFEQKNREIAELKKDNQDLETQLNALRKDVCYFRKQALDRSKEIDKACGILRTLAESMAYVKSERSKE